MDYVETLDYPAAQAKLMAMLGEQIDCGVSGVDSPMVAYFDGVLKAGGEVYGGVAMGYDPNTLLLYVGHVQISLHPDRFEAASWEPRGPGGVLRIQFGSVVLVLRGPVTE